MKRVIRWCIRIVTLTILADGIATAHTLLKRRNGAWRTAPKEALRCLALVLSLLLALAHPAYAVDGVIEINQARAAAGGVSADDSPGFPVTISRRGSYRLTSNLTVGTLLVSGADITAILITTDNLTLDLNGFTITSIGPPVLPPVDPPVAGEPTGGLDIVTGTGRGVDADDQENITVVNGTVKGMGDDGIRLGDDAHVERVHAIGNGDDGIRVRFGSTVTGSTANRNGGHGIIVNEFSTVTDNTANGNGGGGIFARLDSRVTGNISNANDGVGITVVASGTVTGNTVNANGLGGIAVGFGSTVTNNTVDSNDGNGIGTTSGCTVIGNSVSSNDEFGLFAMTVGPPTGYANNVLTNNNGGNANPQVNGVAIEIGTNICGIDTFCP